MRLFPSRHISYGGRFCLCSSRPQSSLSLRMLSARLSRPLTVALRKGSHAPAKVEWKVQTPTSFVHDGWANARMPFSVKNKWLFASKAIAFLAIGFWAPFVIVEYQLRKANSQ